ncbi:MAG: SRPBCC domain-containing protein [Thermoplasmatota archaeon]
MPPTLQKLRQSVLLHAPAGDVYDALLDATTLSRIFGRPVQASNAVGGAFRFFDLIHGANVELERGRRIVQSFRYALPGWPMEHTSKVTIQLRTVPDGTRVILDQSAIPNGCAETVVEHWHDHVWPGLKAILEHRAAATRLPRFSIGRKIVR